LASLIVIIASLLLIALWEVYRPRRRREFPAARRRLGNLGFWIINLFIGAVFAAPDTTLRETLASVTGLGIPSWPVSDPGLSLLAGFLLLDLLQYLVHRLEHSVPLLWRLHALHHSDPDVDVTTAVRHHPLEILFTSVTYWLAVLALGIPVMIVGIHAVAVFSTAAVQHGNLRLPEWLERVLQPAIVTVDMHRIHHSVVFKQANSNYGAVLSVWDWLFGTYTSISRAQQEHLVFGVRELPRGECVKPSAMFLTPWRIPRAVNMD
jgi:sterol desaturase/sphingolipid hydroxylase (fatty acid hydroxylase superfamily)